MKLIVPSLLAATALATAGEARAQGCPMRAALPMLEGLGKPVAQLDDDALMYQPRGVTVLGERAPYVLVKRYAAFGGTLGPIKTVSYRLGSVTRRSGKPYPAGVYNQFSRAHPDPEAVCSQDELSCTRYFNAAAEGDLREASFESPNIYISDDAKGAGLGRLRADTEKDDSYPAFLVCTYEEGEWRDRL